jgi:type I restriction enzyme S subunit
MTGDQDTQDANPDGKYNFYVRSPNVEKSDSYTFEGEGILMAGDGAGAGKVFHHAYGKYAIHQRVYCFYNFRDINTNFFYYYISLLFSIDMEKGSAQSTVPSVRMPMIKDFTFCLPPLHEQEAIAKMLDSKCAQIDSLIAEKESFIADLTEYKKSLIFEVVTGKRSI